ncbi:MAG TPA: hypothetical protein GXZ32_05765 [Clostridiales bacterium]|nr:hypothetical protein [Clostridiales bacterium]
MAAKNIVEVQFNKKGHFWLDSGLVGFIKMLETVDLGNVCVNLKDQENCIILSGVQKDVEKLLYKVYDKMVDEYYNLSTKKQKDNLSSYNFYYDEEKDEFISFPKKKSIGIAEMIYNKAPRPTGTSIKWKEEVDREIYINGNLVKKKRFILPDEKAHLQKRMDAFLDAHGLKVTTSGLLVNGPNAVKPKITINLSKKRANKNCYLCGEKSSKLEDANQTIFPLITGTSGVLSFNPSAGKPEKICWKCSYLGKFVPVNGFYMYQGDNLFAFLPYSASLKKMLDSYDKLCEIRDRDADPNLYKNFQHNLGGYFQHLFEVTFAFFYNLYERLAERNISDEYREGVSNIASILKIFLDDTPLEFFIIHTKKAKDTFLGKMFWPYRDTTYFYRLIDILENSADIDIKSAMACLVDHSQLKNEAKTLVRNRILERILRRQSILDLVEYFVFHADVSYFTPLMEMALVYQSLLKEGDSVYKDEQEAAVKLGRSIGMAVANSENGKKGDLFALRKARRKVDFLEQLNRLQFKLGNDLIIISDVYEGKLTDENFMEFKQFCMIAALNSYYYALSKKNKK